MKRLSLISALIVIAICSAYYFSTSQQEEEQSIEMLREQHITHLNNSPFKETLLLSKEERKKLGLPPNSYNERMFELTMDPSTGRPMPERVLELQMELRKERESEDYRGVGGDSNNPWIDRGPDNVGGRTRGIMFDPNDGTNKRVFAGGVSGGLWVNNDITLASSSWTQVSGLGGNIAVNVIISDPNDSNTFYIGAGESYTSGQCIGNGIWKSTDAGVTWTHIYGGYTSTSTPGADGIDQLVNGIFYINDLVARDVGATTELYAAVTGQLFRYIPSSNGQWNGLSEQGVYKSTNNGTSWTKFTINEPDTSPSNPCDLEIDINNNIWVTTTDSWFGHAGGKVLRSTDGISFSLMHTFTGGTGSDRTELEPSSTTAGTFWVLKNDSGTVNIYTTTNDFTAVSQIVTEPNDADLSIPAGDFTRTAPWYNLTIEADASDNLIVGGIDLFRSSDNGATWTQISKWSNNANLNTLSCSFVHADQHATVFRPGSSDNEVVFGTDGGVFYCSDLSTAGSSATIEPRNKDYNTVQFYYGTIDQSGGGNGDDLSGGTQDNGTLSISGDDIVYWNGTAGANSYYPTRGGDGAFTEIDDATGYMIDSYVYNSHEYVTYPLLASRTTIGANNSQGNFINEAALDKNLDIFYYNSSIVGSSTWRIERLAEFIPGGPAQVNTYLSNALLNANITSMKVSPFTVGSTKLFVGLNTGRLLRIDTADGTPSWTNITGSSFVGSISDIEFGETESDLFVTMHNYGVTSIWYSSNGGTSWASKEGNLPDMPVKCILQNPLIPDEVIIGTQLGVWATADYTVASPNWVQRINGMSETPVLDLDLRTSDNVILASTHGRGQFTSQFTSTPLSVLDTSFDDSTITIYPTISNGQFTLKTNRALGNVTFQLFNINGQSVYNDRFEMNDTHRDFNLNLSNGLYFAKISNGEYAVTKRIIIK